MPVLKLFKTQVKFSFRKHYIKIPLTKMYFQKPNFYWKDLDKKYLQNQSPVGTREAACAGQCAAHISAATPP